MKLNISSLFWGIEFLLMFYGKCLEFFGHLGVIFDDVFRLGGIGLEVEEGEFYFFKSLMVLCQVLLEQIVHIVIRGVILKMICI